MTARDKLLAVGTAVAWGFAFVATKYGLNSFSAAQLTALRFVIPCLLVFVLPRPRVVWRVLIPIGLTLFTGQFLLLFFAYVQGLPPGVASVTQQLQVFFTVLLAACFLRDVPTRQQSFGMVIALGGMGLIVAGLALTMIPWRLPLASFPRWAQGPSAAPSLVRRAASGIQQDDTGDDEEETGNPRPIH